MSFIKVAYPVGTIDHAGHINPWHVECDGCGQFTITKRADVPEAELIGAEHHNCPGRDPVAGYPNTHDPS